MELKIKKLEKKDIREIVLAFKKINWHKPESLYRKYLLEQDKGEREILVAFKEGKFAGYLTIVWKSKYPIFRKNNIPEIVDLNVLPKFQGQKIGTRLMDEAEKIISKKSKTAGIGVALAPGYRFAQKMYVRRGYIPDAKGVSYKDKLAKYGQKVAIDDDLVLHLIKKLK